jgi:UDP-glucose 4-epimerase
MKIIVTGGAGFIGSHVVDRLLEEGNEVLVIDDFSLGKKSHLEQHIGNPHFRLEEADLTDQQNTNALFESFGAECVFHLAANSDIGAGAYDFGPDLKKTFGTTIAVLEAMRKSEVKKLVFASTSAIFGSKEGTIAETSGPLIPESNYGAAKLASEAFISAFSHTQNIQVWIFRFPNVCGPRATHGVFYNFIKFLDQDPAAITVAQDGKQAKPYIYVLDLVEAIFLGWKKGKDHFNVFNVGNVPLVSVNEILGFLLKEKGIENIQINYTGAPAWPGDVTTYTFDDSKIKNLGFKPSYTATQACAKTANDLVTARG